MKKIRIIIPKGSLAEKTLKFLASITIEIKFRNRCYEGIVSNNQLVESASMFRPDIIGSMIMEERFHLGITGLDMLIEDGVSIKDNELTKGAIPGIKEIKELNLANFSDDGDIEIIAALPFSKGDDERPARVAVFAKSANIDLRGDSLCLAEYPNIAQRFFGDYIDPSTGIKKSRVKPSSGTTESAVAHSSRYKLGMGVLDSGATLEENGLVVVKELFPSPVVLIARSNISEEERETVKTIALSLKKSLQGKTRTRASINVRAELCEKVEEILPSRRSPSKTPLKQGWFQYTTSSPAIDWPIIQYQLTQIGVDEKDIESWSVESG